MQKRRKIIAIILTLAILCGCLTHLIINTTHVHAADVTAGAQCSKISGYTCKGHTYGHTWYPSGKDDDCSVCTNGITTNASYTTTKCTTCNGLGYSSSSQAGSNYTIWTYGCINCGGGGSYKRVYDTSTPSGSFILTDYNFVQGSGYKGTCSHCNGKGVNYCCTNSGCKYSGYDNWETESGYSSTCGTSYHNSGNAMSNPATYGCTSYTTNYYTHTAGTTYTTNATSHWKKCIYCGGTMGTANHSFGAEYTENGYRKQKCSTCSYAKTIAGVTYYVKYNGNGATLGSMSDSTHIYGTASNLSANLFSRTGYTFAGWAKTTTGSVVYADSQSVSTLTTAHKSTVNLYASWDPNNYVVTFNGNGGTVTTADMKKTVTYDSEYGELPTPTRKGYTFIGWYTEPEDGEGTRIYASSFVDVAEDDTLYAHWDVNNYTITFDVNGGDSVTVDSATYDYNESVDLLTPQAIKDGYTFIGWTDSPTNTVCYNWIYMGESAKLGLEEVDMELTDITLYAVYSMPTSGVENVYVEYTTSTNNSPLRAPFNYMYDDVNGSYYSIGANLSGILNYAIWVYDNAGNKTLLEAGNGSVPTVEEYKINTEHWVYDYDKKTYDLYTITSDTVLKGSTYTPTYLTNDSLLEKYHPEKIMPEASFTVTESTTVLAYYYPNNYTVLFDTNLEHASCDVASKTVYYNAKYGTLPIPVAEGYEFCGWYTEKNGGVQILSSTIFKEMNDVTLYARWSKIPYTVTYDYATNDGDSSTKITATYYYGDAIDLTPVATKVNYDHIGWNIDPNAITKLVSLKMPAENVTLFAIFERTLNANFHQYDVIEQVSDSVYNKEITGEIITKPIKEYSGWSPIGWVLGAWSWRDIETYNLIHENIKYPIDDELDFYAAYEKEIVLSYDTQIEGMQIASQIGHAYYVAENDINSAGFIVHAALSQENSSFVCWENEQGIEYVPLANITLSENMLLIAKWDDYPVIDATDKYFTLTEAQNGNITLAKLLENVAVTDKEDDIAGIPVNLEVEGYSENEYKTLKAGATFVITYKATDSYGNVTRKSATIHIVEAGVTQSDVATSSRFISSKYYLKGDGTYVPESEGGFNANSFWIINASYQDVLSRALDNLNADNDQKVYKYSFSFDKEEIKEVKEHVKTEGFGNFKALDGLKKFIEKFFD